MAAAANPGSPAAAARPPGTTGRTPGRVDPREDPGKRPTFPRPGRSIGPPPAPSLHGPGTPPSPPSPRPREPPAAIGSRSYGGRVGPRDSQQIPQVPARRCSAVRPRPASSATPGPQRSGPVSDPTGARTPLSSSRARDRIPGASFHSPSRSLQSSPFGVPAQRLEATRPGDSVGVPFLFVI